MRHWLMKTEPTEFSLDDLKARPGQTGGWDGVRNYQARNFMRDDMRLGDLVLIYHSSIKIPAAMGIAEIAREAYPDASAWNPNSPYHDPRSSPERPVWVMVDVRLVEAFPHPVTLTEMRAMPELSDMLLLRRGMRLSIQPVSPAEFAIITQRGRTE